MEPKRSTTIKYINPEVPSIEVPEYGGQRYESLVPDTIDLQEMAREAVNGLTEPTDPEADYEIYWRTAFNSNPVTMWHSESDSVQTKFMEALPLLRLVSGLDQNHHVEQRWMEVARQMQGPDGILYFPKIGRPWCVFGSYGNEPPGDHYWAPSNVGRLLGMGTLYHLLTGDPGWKEFGRKAVDGMNRLALRDGDQAHFANNEYGTEGRYVLPVKPSDAVHNPATFHAWSIQGLANYAKVTGYEPALDLSAKIARWAQKSCNHFGPDGRFLPEYPDVSHIHFHGHTMVLLACLDYGLVAGDKEAVDFARRGFDHGLTRGDCQLGFFAEWLDVDRPQTLEMCELADMMSLAVKLSQSGNGDYWDYVDRWVRNLFYEGQLHEVDRIYWLSERTAGTEIAPVVLPPYHSTDRVAERNVGAFGGWMAPNDWLPDFPYDDQWRTIGIMHCCTGNATRTIYYVWENIIDHVDGKLRVNLLLNRASRWADVDSHLPYCGQVDVKVKEPVELSIRIPEWVMPVGSEYERRMWRGVEDSEVLHRDYPALARHTPEYDKSDSAVRCEVNGKPRKIRWAGRYAELGRMKAGDSVTMTFPLVESKGHIYIEKRAYRVILRGNTCVAIDPPGKNFPLFGRENLRKSETRWRKIERFIPEQQIDW